MNATTGMNAITGRAARVLTAATVAPATLLFAVTAVAAAAPAGAVPAGHHATAHARAPQLRVRQIVNGMKLRHTFVPAGTTKHKSEPLTKPDDMTMMGHDLFTAFQNGVGSQGEPSTDGNTASTVVEYTPAGKVLQQWDIVGKCDGLSADPARGLLIATVNEDAHSSIYTITPSSHGPTPIQHYRYSRPLPHNGGTDAISIYRGRVLVSASAPGTTGKAAPQPSYPAVYSVTFHRTHGLVASVAPVFFDESRAVVANSGADKGKVVKLALTDPDSNEVVPGLARRFAGDFMLTSQADKEQIFAAPGDLGRRLPVVRLSVLRLSQSVDDTAWVSGPGGRLFASDATSDTIDAVSGRFPAGAELVAVTPCDAANAPATCPGPGFPPNYLGSLNPLTGHITRVPLSGASFEPKGMVFAGH
jgi:hypothetical protein